MNEGRVADYIPELARADPAWFAVSVVTTEGECFDVGDSHRLFTLQSISKPFVYGLALQDHGREGVLERVGVEPTGEAFNSIVLDPASHRPFNPMVNAGAIATTDLLRGKDYPERDGPAARRARPLRRTRPLRRQRGVSVGADDRPPQPRHQPPDEGVRHRRRPLRGEPRALLPAVLGAGQLARPGGDGGDAGERRDQPAHARAGARRAPTSRTCSRSCCRAACTTTPASGAGGSGCRPRAASPAACWRWCRACSGSASTRRCIDAKGNCPRGVKACKEFSTRFGLHCFAAASERRDMRREINGSRRPGAARCR